MAYHYSRKVYPSPSTNAPNMLDIMNPFSLEHLPYGIVNFGSNPHLCVRLEDYAISIDILSRNHLLKPLNLGPEVTQARTLNPLLELAKDDQKLLRERVKEVLSRGQHLDIDGCIQDLRPYPEDDPKVAMPLQPRDFVDFYCSRHHAHRVGSLFRGPENALPEQYFQLPIGYHGRASTVFGSGTAVRRPQGLVKAEPNAIFKDSERLDYELEMGFVLRASSGPLSPEDAWEHIFGLVLVNDWSARDIQAFEYKPLGPFLGKSFATTISPWVTPIEAFESFRQENTDSDHSVSPHLQETGMAHHLDIPLEVEIRTAEGKIKSLCQSNLNHLCWSAAQMLSHLSSNGSIVSAGDLIASGTVSGPDEGARACLLELTEGGKSSVDIDGEKRTFLKNGDTITLLGGHEGVGLAPCSGTVQSFS